MHYSLVAEIAAAFVDEHQGPVLRSRTYGNPLLLQVVEFDAKLLTPIVKNMSAIENYNSSMQLPHTFSLSSILSGLDTERYLIDSPQKEEILTYSY